jgi:hypothetical protein
MKVVVCCLLALIVIMIVSVGLIYFNKKNNFSKTKSRTVAAPGVAVPRVAIVTMTKKPIDLQIWIDHHLNKLKVDKIYLRVEESPEVEGIVEKFNKQGKINVEYDNRKIDNSDSYYIQMDRQKMFVNKIKEECRKNKIEYLLHIDDDELFYIDKNKYNVIQDFFKSIHGKVLENNLSNIHFENIEAVFQKNKKHCFDTDKFLDCRIRGNCKSYCNGKSATNVNLSGEFFGPHNFSGKVLNIERNDACVLHFDSACFEKWYQKFENLSHLTSQEKLDSIPFKFYKNSIKLIQEGANKEICEKYWKNMKVDPYYDNIVNKITINF